FGEDSEPATEKGVISHYMRHDENVHRLLMSAGDSLLGKLAADLERERACRVKAEELNWSMTERYQTLLDREHERRVDEAKELMRARRLDELMGVATALLPIFATKFLGCDAGWHQPGHVETSLIRPESSPGSSKPQNPISDPP
ncbi:MAG TPA: hypothetical protein VER11_11860, partial [Polyangiaceae bacterium]|nr:hypothetical protein [Polyangiaceae bacterium]